MDCRKIGSRWSFGRTRFALIALVVNALVAFANTSVGAARSSQRATCESRAVLQSGRLLRHLMACQNDARCAVSATARFRKALARAGNPTKSCDGTRYGVIEALANDIAASTRMLDDRSCGAHIRRAFGAFVQAVARTVSPDLPSGGSKRLRGRFDHALRELHAKYDQAHRRNECTGTITVADIVEKTVQFVGAATLSVHGCAPTAPDALRQSRPDAWQAIVDVNGARGYSKILESAICSDATVAIAAPDSSTMPALLIAYDSRPAIVVEADRDGNVTFTSGPGAVRLRNDGRFEPIRTTLPPPQTATFDLHCLNAWSSSLEDCLAPILIPATCASCGWWVAGGVASGVTGWLAALNLVKASPFCYHCVKEALLLLPDEKPCFDVPCDPGPPDSICSLPTGKCGAFGMCVADLPGNVSQNGHDTICDRPNDDAPFCSHFGDICYATCLAGDCTAAPAYARCFDCPAESPCVGSRGQGHCRVCGDGIVDSPPEDCEPKSDDKCPGRCGLAGTPNACKCVCPTEKYDDTGHCVPEIVGVLGGYFYASDNHGFTHNVPFYSDDVNPGGPSHPVVGTRLVTDSVEGPDRSGNSRLEVTATPTLFEYHLDQRYDTVGVNAAYFVRIGASVCFTGPPTARYHVTRRGSGHVTVTDLPLGSWGGAYSRFWASRGGAEASASNSAADKQLEFEPMECTVRLDGARLDCYLQQVAFDEFPGVTWQCLHYAATNLGADTAIGGIYSSGFTGSVDATVSFDIRREE